VIHYNRLTKSHSGKFSDVVTKDTVVAVHTCLLGEKGILEVIFEQPICMAPV
jgi:hypothetical protein